MKTWEIDGLEIIEVDFNYDLHEFEIYKDGVLIGTITPDTIDDMEAIAEDFNNGISPIGMEDGLGNTISI
jgi:hypothetical protein